jgi:phage gp29-like protein
MLTAREPVLGEPVPERKFIVHRYGGADNPYGLGLGTRLFWPVWFKREGIRMWLTFAEKFGVPTAVGKYPPGADEDQQRRLLDALRAMARETGIVIPQTMEVQLLEATRQGSTDLYRSLCDYMDVEISRIILGLGGRQESGGELAAAVEIRQVVRKEVLQADADLLSDTLNSTLLRWITEFNVPNAVPPKVYRRTDEPENLTERAKRDQILFQMGYQPTEQYVRETYGDGYRLLGAMPPSATSAAFQEPSFPDQDSVDRQDLSGELTVALIDALRPLFEEVRHGVDPVLLRRRLADLYPRLDPSELERLMERVIFAAEVWGRIHGNR